MFRIRILVALFTVTAPMHTAQAAFHFMQIEQVIGGVNGDTTAQAIQLRLRQAAQNQVQLARVRVLDATGSNPILVEDMATSVPNSQAGRRVLLTTPNFANYTNIPLATNFVMDPIPASYLAAGSLTFEDNSGSVYWRLSWGGAGYTGPTTGLTTAQGGNDADGQFGPVFAGALPSTTLQALQFTGAASALSTSNAAQYAVTPGAATFINNANASFTVIAPPPSGTPGDFNDDGVVDAADYVVWRKTEGTNFDLSGNGDESGGSANTVDMADYNLWVTDFGEEDAGSGGAAAIPEPVNPMLVMLSALATSRLRARRPLLRHRAEV
jgi:hypothetical protein